MKKLMLLLLVVALLGCISHPDSSDGEASRTAVEKKPEFKAVAPGPDEVPVAKTKEDAAKTDSPSTQDPFSKAAGTTGQNTSSSGSDVSFYDGNPQPVAQSQVSEWKSTFRDLGGMICKIDGKPVIRMFSKTGCDHCDWGKPLFMEAVSEYVKDGKVVAHLWDFKTGDDFMTNESEDAIPSSEQDIFFNISNRGLPLYVFGCRFARLGNAYFIRGSKESEVEEFRNVIDHVLSSEDVSDKKPENYYTKCKKKDGVYECLKGRQLFVTISLPVEVEDFVDLNATTACEAVKTQADLLYPERSCRFVDSSKVYINNKRIEDVCITGYSSGGCVNCIFLCY